MKPIPIARHHNIVVQNCDNETIIYDLLENKAYLLNDTSAFVWQQLDGSMSIEQISERLGKHCKQPANVDIVWLAINELDSRGLIEKNEMTANQTANLSRREAVKKVGLSTLIAMPVISTLLVPIAANAASCQILTETCSYDNGKQSNCCDSLRCYSTSKCIACFAKNVITLAPTPGNLTLSECEALCLNNSGSNGCCNPVVTDYSPYINGEFTCGCHCG